MKDLPVGDPLFDLDTPPPIAQLPDKPVVTTMTRLKLKNRLPCDECIMLLHANKGVGPYAWDVKYKVRFEDGSTMLLCRQHADARRGTR